MLKVISELICARFQFIQSWNRKMDMHSSSNIDTQILTWYPERIHIQTASHNESSNLAIIAQFYLYLVAKQWFLLNPGFWTLTFSHFPLSGGFGKLLTHTQKCKWRRMKNKIEFCYLKRPILYSARLNKK